MGGQAPFPQFARAPSSPRALAALEPPSSAPASAITFYRASKRGFFPRAAASLSLRTSRVRVLSSRDVARLPDSLPARRTRRPRRPRLPEASDSRFLFPFSSRRNGGCDPEVPTHTHGSKSAALCTLSSRTPGSPKTPMPGTSQPRRRARPARLEQPSRADPGHGNRPTDRRARAPRRCRRRCRERASEFRASAFATSTVRGFQFAMRVSADRASRAQPVGGGARRMPASRFHVERRNASRPTGGPSLIPSSPSGALQTGMAESRPRRAPPVAPPLHGGKTSRAKPRSLPNTADRARMAVRTEAQGSVSPSASTRDRALESLSPSSLLPDLPPAPVPAEPRLPRRAPRSLLS